jgi:hypothetical protein
MNPGEKALGDNGKAKRFWNFFGGFTIDPLFLQLDRTFFIFLINKGFRNRKRPLVVPPFDSRINNDKRRIGQAGGGPSAI